MNLNDLHTISSQFSVTEKMPVLFLGHGNPMNAIEENQFVEGFRNISKNIPNPMQLFVYQHTGLPMALKLPLWNFQEQFMIFKAFQKNYTKYNILQKAILNWQKQQKNC